MLRYNIRWLPLIQGMSVTKDGLLSATFLESKVETQPK